jgi:hypothetical protein
MKSQIHEYQKNSQEQTSKHSIKIVLLTLIVFISIQASAQSGSNNSTKWGFEADAIQPFLPEIEIITAKFTRTIFGAADGKHGDFMIGAFIRPNVKHDVVETIDEYMASIGYRHYFTRSLNFELQYYAGNVDAKKNKVDGKDYSGFVNFAEANIGYKLNLFKLKGSTIYLNPQFGYLQGLNKELIIGPRNGKEDAFIQGKLQIGISF